MKCAMKHLIARQVQFKKKRKTPKTISLNEVVCNQTRLSFARDKPSYLQTVENFKLLTGRFLWPFQK